GVSATQIIFSTMPETYVFSALSLAVLFAIGARATAPRDGLVAAGVASFGMVTTNLGAALLVRLHWLDRRQPWTVVRTMVVYVLLVFAVTAALGHVHRL